VDASAERELRKLDRPIAHRILTAVSKLAADPRQHGARSLAGYPSGTTRIRVGDYRIVYVVDDEVIVITVVRVAHR
jgi:mRNA interferase RelE/StbE